MFYPKLRHAHSNSIIDISSIQHSKHIPSNHSRRLLHSPSSKLDYNQNQYRARKSSYFSEHQLCHSYSDDSLNKEFLQSTKQTVEKLFRQTNFDQILDQIQYTLHPIVKQLREQIERKKYLSKQDRFKCMKSCATFLTETLLHQPWDIDKNFLELYQLQQVLNRVLSKQQTSVSVQTTKQLEKDIMQLHIDTLSPEKTNFVSEKLKKPAKVSFISTDERQIHPVRTSNDLTDQKNYHRSVSRAFKKLNIDLQRMNHETPFKAHLSKYHKHNH